MSEKPVSLRSRVIHHLSESSQRLVVGSVLAVLVIAIVVAWLVPHLTRSGAGSGVARSTPADGFRLSDAQLGRFKTAVVTQTTFRTVRTTEGKIALNGDAITPVFSPYSGRVTLVIAGPGDNIRKGAPLFAIEASEFVQAQNDLVSAAAQFALAKSTETRKHAAFDARGAALQDWEQAQAGLTAAEAAFAAARNRLRILGKTDEEINSLLKGGKADPVTAVLAPISGVVTDRQVGPGQYLQAGASNPAYIIGDLSSVWLVANIREVDAPFVRVGQSIEVHALALPDKVLKATLSYVGSAVDPATRRIAVRAVVANPDGALKPEMFATFDIITDGETEALAVPEAALIYEEDTARVWVVQPDKSLQLRQVRTGRNASGQVEITDGLHLGERVVTSGSLFIDRAARSE
jgi:cobalt-zinc-cadmium efflux system membrane fusion protein